MDRKLLPSVTSAISITVQFTLGRKLDEGGTGMVYEIISSPIGSQGSASAEIPPLVAKIGARSKNKRIAREAWFYDELQTLQGVMVPRCYGCFEARLPDDCTFKPRDERVEEPVVVDPEYEIVPDEEFFRTRLLGAFNEGSRELLTRLDDDRTVTILLLERLSEPFLPVGVPIPDSVS